MADVHFNGQILPGGLHDVMNTGKPPRLATIVCLQEQKMGSLQQSMPSMIHQHTHAWRGGIASSGQGIASKPGELGTSS